MRAIYERNCSVGRTVAILARALRDLDARTLRDLGFDRSEILSVALDFGRDRSNSRVRYAGAENNLRLF